MIYFMIAGVLTLVVLIAGIILMAKGGKLNRSLGNRLMAYRVFFQAIAIAVLAVFAFFSQA